MKRIRVSRLGKVVIVALFAICLFAISTSAYTLNKTKGSFIVFVYAEGNYSIDIRDSYYRSAVTISRNGSATAKESIKVDEKSFQLDGWYSSTADSSNFNLSNGTKLDSGNPLTVSARNDKYYYYVVYRIASASPTVYTLSFSAGEGGTVDKTSMTVTQDPQTVTATPSSGYGFDGWYAVEGDSETKVEGADATWTISSASVNQNASYMAKFSKRPIHVTYAIVTEASSFGTITIFSDTISVDGVGQNVVATPNRGYRFVAWKKANGTVYSTEASLTLSWDEARENSSFYAAFEELEPITLTFSAGEGGTLSGMTTQQLNPEIGVPSAVTATADDGYAFVGWKKDGNLISDSATLALTKQEAESWETATYKAVFVKKITAKYVSADSTMGSVSRSEETFNPLSDTPIGSTAIANPGYRFVGWMKNNLSAPYSEQEQCIPDQNADATYYALFCEVDKVRITYAVNDAEMGSVLPVSEQLNPMLDHATGSAASANPGYRFVGWRESVVSTTNLTERAQYTPSKPANGYQTVTYYAIFEEVEPITISYCVNDSSLGSVSRTSESVNPEIGTVLGSTASAMPGCSFDGWYDENGMLVSALSAFIPDRVAAVYTAKFSVLPVTMTGCQVMILSGSATSDNTKDALTCHDCTISVSMQMSDGSTQTGSLTLDANGDVNIGSATLHITMTGVQQGVGSSENTFEVSVSGEGSDLIIVTKQFGCLKILAKEEKVPSFYFFASGTIQVSNETDEDIEVEIWSVRGRKVGGFLVKAGAKRGTLVPVADGYRVKRSDTGEEILVDAAFAEQIEIVFSQEDGKNESNG